MADQKELAEHLMLLDLGRNDTAKVSKVGTVRPTEQFIVERYSHVMHIVSNVGGVVFDSDPEAEYMETVHKSNAIRRAAADAAMFRSGNS